MSVRNLLFRFTCAAILVAPCAARADEPMIFPADRPVDCRHIKLEFNVDMPKKHVQGRATIDITALRRVESVRFDAIDFDTTRVGMTRDAQNDAPPGSAASEVQYVNDGKSITLVCDPPLKSGESARVAIDYTLEDPQGGLHFFAPSEAEPDIPYLVWSQGESCDNHYWFPCFDHPGQKQTTEMIVTTKAGNEVVSNGKLLDKKEDKAAGTVTFHWKQDKPHAAYLVTLVVGPFAVIEEKWRGKPIRYYVPAKNKEWAERSFGRTTAMLDFFSDKIGVEYPWAQYAQVCCYGFGGGMENTSATTLTDRALHDERSMLDGDADDLIAHEMAHQWWGDLLTCKDWAHTWLNEGFASYFDPLWTEHHKGWDDFAYDMWRNAQGAISGGKDKPIVYRRYGNPDTQFDSRAYPKGSWVLHMLRSRLGDDMWWKCIHRYAMEHRFQCVETVDLRKSFETESGLNLERFFYDWTERPGNPAVELTCDWLSDDKLEKVRIRQTQKEEAFEFPLVLEFHVDGRDPVIVRREIKDKDETMYISLPRPPSLVRIDPKNTVLWELTQTMGRDLWVAQLSKDANPIARIRAVQHFGKSKSEHDVRLLADALKNERFWGVQREIAGALKDAGGDIARDALLAGLKNENPRVRRACAERLGGFRDDKKVIAALQSMIEKGDPSYAVEAAAIEAYGTIQKDGALAALEPLLSRESYHETIRSAVLRAIGEQREPAAIDVLIEWTKKGKPRECLPDAINALARVARNAQLEDAAMRRAVDAIADCLPREGRFLQRAAVAALESLGGAARPALPALEALKVSGPRIGRMQEGIDRAIKKIREGGPVQAEVADLREELNKLKKENESLRDRIAAMEGKGKAAGREKSAGQRTDSHGPSESPFGVESERMRRIRNEKPVTKD